MTLEHRILMLIDRGVRSIDDIRDFVDGRIAGAVALQEMRVAGHLGDDAIGFVSITPKGLERLNELDEI